MLKNILTGNVVISYVFDKISISNDREKNIPRRIRITLVSDIIHILTITLKKSGRFLFLFRMNVLLNISYQFFYIRNSKRISTQILLLNKYFYKPIQILLYFGEANTTLIQIKPLYEGKAYPIILRQKWHA